MKKYIRLKYDTSHEQANSNLLKDLAELGMTRIRYQSDWDEKHIITVEVCAHQVPKDLPVYIKREN